MQLSAQFKLEKETKGTFRYAEETAGQPPKIGTLYIQKRALPTPPPNRITITLEAGWRLPWFSPNSFLSLLLHGFGASAFARNAYT